MTGSEFRQQHGDPTTWTWADHETYDNLRRNDQHLASTHPPCWFCGDNTPTNTPRCGLCGHRADAGPAPGQTATDLRHHILGLTA